MFRYFKHKYIFVPNMQQPTWKGILQSSGGQRVDLPEVKESTSTEKQTNKQTKDKIPKTIAQKRRATLTKWRYI